jgi:hypothetical protein
VLHKVVELLMAFWKTILQAATDLRHWVTGESPKEKPEPKKPVQGPYRQEGDLEPKKPVEAKPKDDKPKETALAKVEPEVAKPKVPKDGSKLVCTLTGEDSRSKTEIEKIKVKTRRRALRHFDGKEVRHRVTEKKADSIEFAYFRRSGKPVKIRWQKAGARTEQNPG